VYKTDLLMDYSHRPVFSIDHDVSETDSVSVQTGMFRIQSTSDDSNGRIGIEFTLLHPPEDGDRASLRNVVFYIRNRTMDIVHKRVSLVQNFPYA
jgi:hypothetical protein